jgi:flagellar hook-basal body complex protein FliE
MITMRTERADISQLLQQMKQVQSQLKTQGGIRESAVAQGLGAPQGVGGTQAADKPQGFGDLFKQAINSVNDTQQQATALATSYEKGDARVSLAQVMVASQKASVSFQAITQVRNKLVEAYQDVMNMPI